MKIEIEKLEGLSHSVVLAQNLYKGKRLSMMTSLFHEHVCVRFQLEVRGHAMPVRNYEELGAAVREYNMGERSEKVPPEVTEDTVPDDGVEFDAEDNPKPAGRFIPKRRDASFPKPITVPDSEET